MKAIVVLCALVMVAASPAQAADWIPVSKSTLGVIYIDSATIRKDGNLRQAWQITDYQVRGEEGELSERSLYEYDCKEGRVRGLTLSIHSGPMAGGKTLHTAGANPKGWSYEAPDTAGWTLLKFVCSR